MDRYFETRNIGMWEFALFNLAKIGLMWKYVSLMSFCDIFGEITMTG